MKRLVFQRIAAARGSVLLILQHLRFPWDDGGMDQTFAKGGVGPVGAEPGVAAERPTAIGWKARCKCRLKRWEEMAFCHLVAQHVSCVSRSKWEGFPHSLIGSFFVGIISKFICISTCTMWWLYFAMFLCRMNWFRVWDAFGSLSWRFDMDWLVRLVLKLLCFTVQPLKDLDQESQQVREEEKFQKRLNAWDIWLDSCCDRSGESMWIHDSLSSSM